MDMQETLKMIGLLLAPAFFSLLGMGALGSPAVAFLGEISAKSRKKVFFDKYGQQTGTMGLILLVLLIVIYGASIGVGLAKFPQMVEQTISPASPLFPGLVAFGVFALFGLAYFLTWKKMRNTKGLHMTLGAISALAALTAVALATPAKLAMNLPGETTSAGSSIDIAAMALPIAVMYALLILSAAAGLSLAYLVLRRNKDDFGRDYYNFSLRLAARWALLPMVGFLGCQGWLFVRLPEKVQALVMSTPLAYVWGALGSIGVITVVVWLAVARSETPLRLKGLAFLAVFLFWALHALNATLFVNFMAIL